MANPRSCQDRRLSGGFSRERRQAIAKRRKTLSRAKRCGHAPEDLSTTTGYRPEMDVVDASGSLQIIGVIRAQSFVRNRSLQSRSVSIVAGQGLTAGSARDGSALLRSSRPGALR